MPATLLSCSAVLTVLAAGSPEQAKTVAEWVREGRTVAFALSEEESGSDILAGRCRLDPTAGGYALTGRKWLVGRAPPRTRRSWWPAPRRAAPPPSPRSCSAPTSWRRRRRAPSRSPGCAASTSPTWCSTTSRCRRPPCSARVGGGLAAAMRAQQLSAALAAACLATADTALRTALRFTRARRTGGVPVAETGHGARELALAAAELMAADLSSLTAARHAHLAPGTFGLYSSVVKRAPPASPPPPSPAPAPLGARASWHTGPGPWWTRRSGTTRSSSP
ncbi:Acyl-CoA dehydrogenase OS=Streptomyces glaucescens OX=1907 GN=SGLAU_07195 PE=3 SV=1 [Streptomyces glaucescens]